MEPPAGGHVQVSRLFEPGSAGVRQAQLVQQDQSVQWQAVLTYDELFDARHVPPTPAVERVCAAQSS